MALEARQLGGQFLTQILHPLEVLAGTAHARLRLPPPVLVPRHPRHLFDEGPQILGLALNNARDHPLLNHRIGTRAQPGAVETAGDVLAPAFGPVEEIVRLPVAGDLATHRQLRILGVGARRRAVGVIEDQLHGGASQRLAGGRAAEYHIGHVVAAQVFRRALAQHPPHRVDNIRLSATIRPDDADQIAGQGDSGGIDERLETGELDSLQAHRISLKIRAETYHT